MNRNTAGLRAAFLLALGTTILVGQLQTAWAVGHGSPEARTAPAPSGKAFGLLKNGRLAAPTNTTLPVVAPATTIPPAGLERRAQTLAKDTSKKNQRTSSSGAAAQRGKITIKKDSVPDSTVEFSFSGDLGEFELRDEVGLSFSDLKPGVYKVTEAKTEGWSVDHIVCGDPTAGASIQDKGRTVTITLPPGGNTTCTFVNMKSDDVSGDDTSKGEGSGKDRDPFGKNDRKDPDSDDLPFTGFQPDWFMFAAGMLLISGGILLRPEDSPFSL